MPTFVENSNASRDLRVLPSYAPPLPRLTPHPPQCLTSDERYEVVVVGAGPSGLLLTLLLARYGLNDKSLLCIDSKPGTLKSGQADGLQPRTLEVLHSLGLANEVLTEGCQMWEVAFWNVPESGEGIERTAYAPDVAVPARFPHEITIHQGRIERIMATDLARYSDRGVQFATQLTSLQIDEAGDAEYPVSLKMVHGGSVKHVRAKHVVGADGARSTVRKSISINLEGESQDHIWGVVDLVVDTNFPDIRRRCAIHSAAGSVMVIPRERISTGQYLTRLYVQVNEDVPQATDLSPGSSTDDILSANLKQKEELRKRRERITLNGLLTQARKVFAPYSISVKTGTEVDWWAAYQIGQRMCDRFLREDKNGVPRVFIVGDACHTHSPKAGQGMNVSMMDSYNLAFKLAYHVHGLTPFINFSPPTHHSNGASPKQPASMLHSYEHERRDVARQLIEFDTKFSSMFSGKMGSTATAAAATRTSESTAEPLTHEQFLEVFSKGSGFTSGCGIEYPPSVLVCKSTGFYGAKEEEEDSARLLEGKLHPGRRLINARVIRHADGNPRDLQDDFPSHGLFTILLLTTTDLLTPSSQNSGTSATFLSNLSSSILPRYPSFLLNLTILHPLPDISGCSWSALPAVVHEKAEMRFHCGVGGRGVRAGRLGMGEARFGGEGEEDAYTTLGVDKDAGAVAVVRPDGVVGLVVFGLGEGEGAVEKVKGYLDGVLVRV